MADEEFAKTLRYKVGDKLRIKTHNGECTATIEEIDISAHKPYRLQNPYKIRYEWGETIWTDLNECEAD